jgi:hypothetical protein
MNDTESKKAGAASLQRLSGHDLAEWGVNVIAYVKKVPANAGEVFAIHAANGEALGLAANRELAFATIRQNDLEPVSVH